MTQEERRRRLTVISPAVGSATATGMAAAIGVAVERDEALALRTANPEHQIDPPSGEPPPTLYLPDLPIVVQAIVEPIGKVPAGSIVTTVGPVWNALLKALAADPEALRKLTPRRLEELVAASYEQEGVDAH